MSIDTYIIHLECIFINILSFIIIRQLSTLKYIHNYVDTYLISTTPTLEGYKNTDYLGIVSGQVVIGTGFLSSLDASYADFGGGEASAYTKKLAQARKVAQMRAIQQAMDLGGNALVGIDVEHTTFSRDLISVTITGTSVKVEKIEE